MTGKTASSVPARLDDPAFRGLDPALLREWGRSEDSYAPPPFFLEPAFIGEAVRRCGIDPGEAEPVLQAAERIRASAPLSRLMWHQHHLLFRRGAEATLDGLPLPDRLEALGGDFPAYNLLLAFSGLPLAEAWLARFPPEVLQGVFTDIGLWFAHFRRSLGIRGLSTRILAWEHGLIRGALCRIGRLQFAVKSFHPDYLVYRNRNTGAVTALVRDGVAVDSAGLLDGVEGVTDPDAWLTRFEREPEAVTGHRVSPRGIITRERVRLGLDVWACVLRPGEPILDVHIPGGGPLAPEGCNDSLTRAAAFFAAFFPERPVRGFSCHAWLLDIQLERLLPPHSRILAFQREWHLYPSRGGGSDSLVRIFGENGLREGPARAPRATHLQREAAAFLERGGRFRAGGGFFLIDDLPFGRQIYIKQEQDREARSGPERSAAWKPERRR